MKQTATQIAKNWEKLPEIGADLKAAIAYDNTKASLTKGSMHVLSLRRAVRADEKPDYVINNTGFKIYSAIGTFIQFGENSRKEEMAMFRLKGNDHQLKGVEIKYLALGNIKSLNKNDKTVAKVASTPKAAPKSEETSPALTPGDYKAKSINGTIIRVGFKYNGLKVIRIWESKLFLKVRFINAKGEHEDVLSAEFISLIKKTPGKPQDIKVIPQVQATKGTKSTIISATTEEKSKVLREAANKSNDKQANNNSNSQLKSNKMAVVKKSASTAKKATGITAYNVKTKEKGVEMLEAVINIKNNRYIAQGVSAGGDKLTAIMNQATAEAHIAAGNATKGEGWPKAAKK